MSFESTFANSIVPSDGLLLGNHLQIDLRTLVRKNDFLLH